MSDVKIGVIGAGVMGRTLIQGMLASGVAAPEQLCATVHTRVSRETVAKDFDIDVATGAFPAEWAQETDVFLVCTKPYRVMEILSHLAQCDLKRDAVVISIAAGTTIGAMEAELPGRAVIRAMPNTPCRIRAGVTVFAPGRHVQEPHLALTQRIFSSVGRCLELDESHMDAVTAVSGSGPAYIYLVMEALADGAVKVGLPRDVAFELVSQTVLGSAMMLQQSDKHPAMLKDEVTTPKGCTISGLLTLEDGRIRSILARAVEEATRTAAGLG